MKTLQIMLLTLLLLSLGCSQTGSWGGLQPETTSTLAFSTPFPPGSQTGGLGSVFASTVWVDGVQNSRCFKLFRFYPDGAVVFAELACFEERLSSTQWPDIQRWLQRENDNIDRGEYALLGSRIFIHIQSYDVVHETTLIRTFQGEICQDRLVLQEPAVRRYSGVPSELTQPVVEFNQFLEVLTAQPDVSSSDPGIEGCRVAGFRFLARPLVVLAGGQAEYTIQTDPGELCSLEYTAPTGEVSQAAGTGQVLADAQGICRWVWDVGQQAGVGQVRLLIDEIDQVLDLELR